MSAELIGPTFVGECAAIVVDVTVKCSLLHAGVLLSVGALRRWSATLRHDILLSGLLLSPVVALCSSFLRSERIWLEGLPLGLSAVLLSIYAVGALLVLSRLLLGLTSLRRLLRDAAAEPWLAALQGPGIPPLYSADVSVPLTFGVLRPVVLFPRIASTWTAAERQSALSHELGHIHRADWAAHVMSQVVVALLWFSPLVWHLSARIRLEAEHAADDSVLDHGVSASLYAGHLLNRCEELVTARHQSLTMTMLSSDQIEPRVRSILGTRCRRGGSRLSRILSLSVLTAIGVSVSAAPLVNPPQAELSCAPSEAAATGSGPWAVDSAVAFNAMLQTNQHEAALHFLLAELESLPEAARLSRQNAAQLIVRSCAFRRSGVALIVTLHDQLQQLDASRQPAPYGIYSAEVIDELGALEALVSAHMAYLDALGVSALPQPGPEDDLYGRPDLLTIMDRSALLRSPDPISLTIQSLNDVKHHSAQMSEETGAQLTAAAHVLGYDNGYFLLQSDIMRRYQKSLMVLDSATTAFRDTSWGQEERYPVGLPSYNSRVKLMSVRLGYLIESFWNNNC
jgi:hypothetical protein